MQDLGEEVRVGAHLAVIVEPCGGLGCGVHHDKRLLSRHAHGANTVRCQYLYL